MINLSNAKRSKYSEAWNQSPVAYIAYRNQWNRENGYDEWPA
jgi:hypothetical protein